MLLLCIDSASSAVLPHFDGIWKRLPAIMSNNWRNARVDLIWKKTEGPFMILIVCRTAGKTQAAGVCNYLFRAR